MADTAFNTYGNATDLEAFLVQQDTGDAFRKLPKNLVAHAQGFTASDKGKTPYVDATGVYANLSIGANGSLKVAASGLPAWLAPGTNGYVLTMVAGAPAWSSAVPAAMTQISAQTVSSPVAAVTFSSIPATGYSKFVLVGVEVVSARVATTAVLNVQVSTDNGSTFKTTSGDYYTNGATASTYLVRATVAGASSTYQHGHFTVEMTGLGNASRATAGVKLSQVAGVSVTNVDTTLPLVNDAGMRVAVETDNAFRIVDSTGANISSGKFILYGVTET